MRVKRTSWLVALSGPVLLVLTMAGCDPDPVPARLALYPECPGHPFKIRYYQITATEDTVARDSLSALPNAGAISGIPEYHDCQKLGLGQPASYGTLAGVFAYEALGSLFVQGADPAKNRAAAEIVAFEQAYEPLHLEVGFNCLYLWEAPQGWSARIFPAGGDPVRCTQVLADWPPNEGRVLSVQAEQVAGMVDEDYPPVARWEWDPVTGVQFIGIRCGANWCSVRGRPAGASRYPERGADAVASSPSPGLLPDSRRHRSRLVRGWYDEQRLALPGTAPGQLAMTEIVGAIIPHPELGLRKSEADYAGTWTEVARVLLDPAAGVEQYQTKLGLVPGVNVIELQQFSEIPTGIDAPTGCDPDAAGLVWLARVASEGRQPILRCVERIIHPGSPNPVAAPGTARWRWDPDDEKTWVTCPQGCCTIN